MADSMILGLFDNITATTDALADIREAGVDDKHVSVMSSIPYTPKMLGRKPPRQIYLPFVLAGAVAGALFGLFIVYLTPRLYPIIVGGQPLTPFPPSAIIVGEYIALGAMAATFVGFFIQNGFPVLRRQMYDERITDGYIGVQVRAKESVADRVVDIFESFGAVDVRQESASTYRSPGIRHLLFWGGAGTAGLIGFAVPLLFTYNIINIPWVNLMHDSPGAGYQEGPRRAAPAESVPVQGPVLLNDQPATEPLPATEDSIERGKVLYAVHCSMCHGAEGTGERPMQRYFPEAADLTSQRIQDLPAEHIFMVITNGYNRMPALRENVTPGETWDVVNYILSFEPAGQ